MKLYYAKGACSLAPHIVLNELGLPYEAIAVDLAKKQYAGGDYLKVNPKGAVPTLETDEGEVLTEAAVVLQYLADRKPQAGLIPAQGSLDRYRCLEWLNFIATELHKGFGPLWNPHAPPEAKEQAKTMLGKRFDFIANRIRSNGPFLMGDRYTVADAYLFTILSWTKIHDIDLGKWPALVGYSERVKARPATHSTLVQEGLAS